MAFGYLNTAHRSIPHSLIPLASVIVYTAYCQLTMLRLKDLNFEWSSFYNVITYHVYEVHICILKVIEFLMLFFFIFLDSPDPQLHVRILSEDEHSISSQTICMLYFAKFIVYSKKRCISEPIFQCHHTTPAWPHIYTPKCLLYFAKIIVYSKKRCISEPIFHCHHTTPAWPHIYTPKCSVFTNFKASNFKRNRVFWSY